MINDNDGGDNNINVENGYETTKQALNLIGNMTDEEFEEWNQRQLDHEAEQRRIDAFDDDEY